MNWNLIIVVSVMFCSREDYSKLNAETDPFSRAELCPVMEDFASCGVFKESKPSSAKH